MLQEASAIILVASVMNTSGLPIDFKDVTDYYCPHLLLSPYPATEAVNSAVDAQEMISRIKNEGLPMSALADLMLVERKSIYNWLDGGNIQEQNLARLSGLYTLLLDENNPASLRSLYRLFQRPLEQGKTLHTLLTEQDLDAVAIREALEHLWPIAKAYQDKEFRRPATMNSRENPLLAEIPEVIAADGQQAL